MNNLSPHCTCTHYACPLHPTKHEKGCSLCIAKSLKKREIPACLFNLIDPDHNRTDDKFADFVNFYLAEQKQHE